MGKFIGNFIAGLYAEIVCFHYVGGIGNADGECSPSLDVLYSLVCLGEVQNNGVPLLAWCPMRRSWHCR